MTLLSMRRRVSPGALAAVVALLCSLGQVNADPNPPAPGGKPENAANASPAQPSPAQPGGAPAAAAPEAQADPEAAADWLEKTFAGNEMPESVRMLVAIARGSQMGPGEGWFGPGQSRYDWKWLAAATGLEAAEEIAREQFRGSPESFARLDRNQDGRITPADLDWSDRNPYVQQFNFATRMLRRIDKSGDGRLARDEVLAFFDAAAAGRDYVTPVDLVEKLLAGYGSSAGSHDGPTAETLARGLFRGEIGSLQAGPALNSPAPDFTLKTHDGLQTIRLDDLCGQKPVVLVFGNFTCGPFRAMYPLVDELHKRYQDRAVFLAVYVREAHPTDGWRMDSNNAAGVELAQPKTYDERVSVAQQCQKTLDYSMPLVVDEINDPVGNAYSGMPARLYLIDTDGKVAYKSGRGPFGFKPGELEQALVMMLLDQQLKSPPPAPPAAGARHLPILDEEQAWRRLPPLEQGMRQPLPGWARLLVDSLPRTTAAMLELDALHRTRNPLGAAMAAKVRWTVAKANRSAYGMASAEADLRRAGLDDAAIASLAADGAESPREEEPALDFARRLTLEADEITDDEVARIKELHGEPNLVALVLLVAHANFQDRLLLALGAEADLGEPLPPFDGRFAKPRKNAEQEPSITVPERVMPESVAAANVPEFVDDPEWHALDFAAIESLLTAQRARPGRIRVPPWEEVAQTIPEEQRPKQPVKILWSLVCRGYQPELAKAWSACLRTFAEESKQDRVFEESLFWVITRTIHCFY